MKNNKTQLNVSKAVQFLRQGKLVMCPSDTVYGLLVDATNEDAVRKLLQFKNRPIGKPISVFVSDFDMLHQHVSSDSQQELMLKELLPGPFTVVLPSKHKVSKLLESERGSLGVRIPDYQFITDVVSQFGRPVTATSANISGRPPHYSMNTLLKEFPKAKKELIDFVVDAGDLPRNKPSTVVDLTASDIKILRQGDIVFTSKQTYISRSPAQTKKFGQYLIHKYMRMYDKMPLVFVIQGELGAGKTVLVKGIGETLGVLDIISPTYNVYDEYRLSDKPFKYLIHCDLYNVQEENEFDHLGLEKYFEDKNIICIEWGEKMGKIFDLAKRKANVIYVNIEHIDENTRKIIVKD